ncbi:hypothetical protein BOX15_Mlig005232g3, partial [Macrostomum lignano]
SDADLLREICSSNGLPEDREKLQAEAAETATLEIFFGGYPRFAHLSLFPNLRELIIVEQSLTEISTLDSCPLLEVLWVSDCRLTQISGLSANHRLKKLYLHSNSIATINGGLDHLGGSLEVLWLANNQLRELAGFEKLSNLKELNLAQNFITEVAGCLTENASLESLNLSGNPLASIRDVVSLAALPSLRRFCLRDPQYRPCPVTQLSNYSIFILYHMPRLLNLDTFDCSSRLPFELADSTVLKKRMYYAMRAEVLERTSACLGRRVTIGLAEYHKARLVETGAGNFSQLEAAWPTTRGFFTEALKKIEMDRELAWNLLNMELESGGSVRCELGTGQDWHKLVADIVSSRFCSSQHRQSGVTACKVDKVHRLHLPVLAARYQEACLPRLQTLARSTYCSLDMVAKKYQDYLFYRWPEGDNDSLLDCLERGVTSRPAVLSNSVNIADGATLCDCAKETGVGRSRLLLVKAYIGKSVQAVASLEEVETIIAAANGGEQLSQESGDEEPKRQLTAVFRMADSTSEGYSCECLGRQCTWYFLDNACLVPEFLVELEYSGRRTSNPFHQVVCGGGPAAPTPDLEPAPPVTAPYENLAELQIEALGLTRLRGLDSLHSLRTLNARSNLLTGLEDLAGLPVEEIDVSWNRIVSIDGLKHVGKLRSLRLAFNRLTCLRNELSHMRKHTAMLTGLSLEGNPWHRYKVAYRVIVINKLKELKVLDGQPVTEEEVTASMPGRFNLLSYAAHVTGTPKYISLESPTQFLPVQPPELFAQVSMLNLDGLNLTRITGLERCFNLRWLSINYNHVSRIEGLDSCSQLEELLATHNLIGTMPTGTYPALRHLNLAHNCIEQIGTGLLAPNLTSLNLLNNHVSSLAGIDKHSSLAQLFIGLNRIQDTRELFYLKSLQSLLILDLGENPIASNSHNYRTTVIYHLRSLCSLDGVPVEQDEVQSAVQLLGGKLTTDLLIEKFGHDRFYDLKELDMSRSNLRTIELNLHDRFINLRSVNLESNSLTTLNGIASLPSLRVLCLNHNHIESLASGTGSLLPTLEVLHLAYNGIKDAASLQLHRLPSLRTLFMQGNELQTTDGLQSGQLRELVLDRNKLRTINLSGCPYVQELHVEENRLKDLGGIPD